MRARLSCIMSSLPNPLVSADGGPSKSENGGGPERLLGPIGRGDGTGEVLQERPSFCNMLFDSAFLVNLPVKILRPTGNAARSAAYPGDRMTSAVGVTAGETA